MSPRAKQQLYHSLAELLRAGVTFPSALEKLRPSARGSTRTALARMHQALNSRKTVAEACASARPMIGPMEAAVLAAVERAGSLDHGLEQLADHFGALAEARRKLLAKLAYPAFVLLLGVVLLNAPQLVTSGVEAYLRTTLATLGGVFAAVITALLLRSLIADAATISPLVERLVRLLPLVGGMQRAFAMSRFCLAYDLQLEAGINTFDALTAAAKASRSSLVRACVRRALPEIRAGAKAGPLLAWGDAFDPAVVQGILTGEECGRLDRELQRLAAEQRARAFTRLEALAEWLPRLVYLAVVGYVGWTIVRLYQGYLNTVQSLIDG
jgi:type II secretory pathway component PulF